MSSIDADAKAMVRMMASKCDNMLEILDGLELRFKIEVMNVAGNSG